MARLTAAAGLDARAAARPARGGAGGTRSGTLRHLSRIAALALLALSGFSSFAGAAERVRFGAAEGDLVLPPGRGPFAAIVVLHSCLGPRADRDSARRDADRLGLRGAVRRRFRQPRAQRDVQRRFPAGGPGRRRGGGVSRLARRDRSSAHRRARLLAGRRRGLAIAIGGAGLGRFHAVAALYPPCGNDGGRALRLPTLVLVGDADTVTPAADCQRARRRAAGRPIGDDARRLQGRRPRLRRSRLCRRQVRARHAARL